MKKLALGIGLATLCLGSMGCAEEEESGCIEPSLPPEVDKIFNVLKLDKDGNTTMTCEEVTYAFTGYMNVPENKQSFEYAVLDYSAVIEWSGITNIVCSSMSSIEMLAALYKLQLVYKKLEACEIELIDFGAQAEDVLGVLQGALGSLNMIKGFGTLILAAMKSGVVLF